MNSDWIVSQLEEPVNDYGLLHAKGGVLSSKSQAFPYFNPPYRISEIQQLEE